MLSVTNKPIMLSVIMLSVMAPFEQQKTAQQGNFNLRPND